MAPGSGIGRGRGSAGRLPHGGPAAPPGGAPARGGPRENLLVLGGTVLLGVLALLVLLGIGLPKIALAGLILAGAGCALFQPEIGLHALLLNALLGLTHVADLPRVGPLSVPVALEAVLVLAVIWNAATGRWKLYIASPQHLLFFGLALWMFVGLIANGTAEAGNLAAIRNLFLVRMLAFVLLTNILRSGAALKRLAIVLTLANVGLLATSWLVRTGFFGAEKMSLSDRFVRTSGLVHNPNGLAFDLTMLLILAAAAFVYVSSPGLKVLLAGLALLDILAILTTLSRSGFVSLVVVIGYLLWRLRRNLVALVGVAILVALVVALLPWGLEFRFGRVDEIRDVDRLQFAQVGLNTALRNPVFGVGFGNYIARFPEHNTTELKSPQPTHNMYLDLAAQMGFPALAIYLAVFAITWRRLAAMRRDLEARRWQASFLYPFGWAMEACFVNLAIFGLSGDVEFEYSVFIVLGFAMLLHREYRRRVEAGVPGRRHHRAGGGTGGEPGAQRTVGEEAAGGGEAEGGAAT